MADVNKGQDMFLRVETARQGPIKGESKDEKHADEIDIINWSWGMQAQTALAGSGSSAKSSINELNIVKRVDSASTALMSALRNNDAIKKAVLCVRKAGSKQHDYFKITIEKGRITSINLDSTTSEAGPELIEALSFAFQKISVEYVPQGADGQPRGSMSFEASMEPS